MEIFNFYDIINKIIYYFVPDAATQAAGIALNKKNTNWVVGDINTANAQLATVQTTFLALPEIQSHITCTKSVGQDAEGHNIWVGCNFFSETDNTDTIYELYTDTNPGFIRATGLAEAKTVYAQKQQDILNWAGLAQVTTLTALPK
jgi:hypothetical protein